MEISYGRALWRNFLGQSPDWYKLALIIFLIINPLVFAVAPFVAGWLLVVEFIFTLAMALKCYPLLPGGLLAIEALLIGMTSPAHVREEIASNLEVLLLLMFMVAGIYFMKQLLLFVFTRLLLGIRSKMLLSLAFCLAAAFLSAFLDALTVVAVVISVAVGFYGIYHRVASARPDDSDLLDDSHIEQHYREVLEQFRGFLRSLMMHAGVGTALGGVMTMVGEPQNLIIAKAAGWHFGEFFLRMAPVTLPVMVCGLLTCLLVEKYRLFGYGEPLPPTVRKVLQEFDDRSRAQRSRQERLRLIAQALIGVWLIVALAFHLAEVGLIGLSVIILATTFTGVTDEHAIGKAFTEALPFTALLTVFFAVVAVIIDQQLFTPVIEFVLQASPHAQLSLFYLFNGLLSSIGSVRSAAGSAIGSVMGHSLPVGLPVVAGLEDLPVPALAAGAVIPPNRKFLALLGDQGAGTNVEAPLATIRQAMAEVLTGWNGANDGQPINVYIGEELLDSVIANSERRRSLRSGGR